MAHNKQSQRNEKSTRNGMIRAMARFSRSELFALVTMEWSLYLLHKQLIGMGV
jgi:hypothetical protein